MMKLVEKIGTIQNIIKKRDMKQYKRLNVWLETAERLKKKAKKENTTMIKLLDIFSRK